MVEKKVEEKEEEVKKVEQWTVEPIPSEFQPGIVKGDVVIDANAAIALMLNNQEKILKTLGES